MSFRTSVFVATIALAVVAAARADDADIEAKLPPPISRPVDFLTDIKPLFTRRARNVTAQRNKRAVIGSMKRVQRSPVAMITRPTLSPGKARKVR
jgi:hypothetical protein